MNLSLINGVVIFIDGYGRMVVKSLGHEHLSQFTFLSRAFLDFGPLVLEPDFDLVLIQAQFGGQISSPLLSQISVIFEFFLQSS